MLHLNVYAFQILFSPLTNHLKLPWCTHVLSFSSLSPPQTPITLLYPSP